MGLRATDAPRCKNAEVMSQAQILLLLTPIIVIELGLIVFALHDLLKPERLVRGDSKLMWGILIVVFGLLGPILYLAVGRREA